MGSQGFRRLRPALPPWSWKPAETVRSTGFCCGAARLSRLCPGLYKLLFYRGSEGYVPPPPWSWKPAETWHSAAFEASPGALRATSIGGPEVDVRHCRLGAGRPLKRSVPLGFAVAQHGFRGFAWGSTSYFSNRKSRHRGPILPRFWKYGKTKRKMKHLCGLVCKSCNISHILTPLYDYMIEQCYSNVVYNSEEGTLRRAAKRMDRYGSSLGLYIATKLSV